MNRILLFISFFSWVLCSLAQPSSYFLKFNHVTIKEGLSHNSILSLAQDHNGYIWVGTQNGLNKYDGYDFELYKSNTDNIESTAFQGKQVLCLFEDSEDNLWAGTSSNGINLKYKNADNFINIPLDSISPGFGNYEIYNIYEDSKNNIWICTIGGGLIRYSVDHNESIVYKSENSLLPNDFIFDIIEDSEGNFWIASSGFGVSCMDRNGRIKTFFGDDSSNPQIGGYRKTLLLDGEVLWIGNDATGLYKFNTITKEITHFYEGNDVSNLSSNAVRDLEFDKNGALYIALDGGGLNVLFQDTNLIQKHNYEPSNKSSLSSNALICLIKDQTDKLWIGSYNGGINTIENKSPTFSLCTPSNNVSKVPISPSVLSVLETTKGEFLIGTDGGGLNYLDQSISNNKHQQYFKRHQKFHNILGNENVKVVKSLFEDSNSNLWIGTYAQGLIKYDREHNSTKRFYHSNENIESISGSHIWDIDQDKKGRLWIATVGDGLNLYNEEQETFTHFIPNSSNENSISSATIMTILVDNDDLLWIGTKSSGIDLYNADKDKFIHYSHRKEDINSLSSDYIRAIYQEKNGTIWIGTEGGGVNKMLSPGVFEHIKEKNGLISNEVMGITEDDFGNIIVSTYKGISYINQKDNTITNIDLHNIKYDNQCNQMAILKSENGIIYVGGINGLNIFDSDFLIQEKIALNISFTEFKIFNEKIEAGKKYEDRIILENPIEQTNRIILNPNQNSFEIEAAVINQLPVSKFNIEYKLEGFDFDWNINTSGKLKASYTNLDPGTYSFLVKSEREVKKIEIVINTPFYKTWWFEFGVVLCFFMALYFLNKFDNNRREKEIKQQLLDAESKILQLRNKNLEMELNAQNSKLLFSTAQMAHKNEILTKVKEELVDLQSSSKYSLRSSIRMLDQELEIEDYWQDFNAQFHQADKKFINALKEKHKGLTKNDIRLCALIRIEMETKEIASLLNISVRGVEKGKYRLKKRLDLSKDYDLIKYITNFEK